MTDLWKLCKKDKSSWPPFTNFKFRAKTGYSQEAIDYIFLVKNQAIAAGDDGSIKNASVSEYLDTQDLVDSDLLDKEMANPCKNHPSDHYCLAYKVKIGKKE